MKFILWYLSIWVSKIQFCRKDKTNRISISPKFLQINVSELVSTFCRENKQVENSEHGLALNANTSQNNCTKNSLRIHRKPWSRSSTLNVTYPKFWHGKKASPNDPTKGRGNPNIASHVICPTSSKTTDA